MMSGARLCSLLAELGFDGAESLDPDSFEWPFQYEDARPVLDWICSSLRPSNVISSSELSQYERLLEEGMFLEGEDLDFAYHSISTFSNSRVNQEAVIGEEEGLNDIRDATVKLKADALEYHKQLQHLQFQFDILSKHASSLTQGRRARVAATSAVNGQLTRLDDDLSGRNLEMNEVLGRIASTAEEFARLHSEDENSNYMVYSDFKPYLDEDASCMKELNLWFAKQIDTGPFHLVVEEGKRQGCCANIEDIANTIDSENDKSYHQRVSELRRLRSIYGTSERQWVEAHVENAKQQAILLTLKEQIASDESHLHHDLHSLRRRHSDLVAEISSLNSKYETLFENIPLLCSDLSELQDTYILHGDYDLKIMQQECYIDRQKAFIKHLIRHMARHELLKKVCEAERKTIHEACSLLKALRSDLEGYSSSSKGRVEHYLALIDAAEEVQEQGAVEDRDTFIHGVRDLLSIHSTGFSTYVSVPGIVQQASALSSEIHSLQHELEVSLPDERNRCINRLCARIQELQQLLFSSSTTSQPVLTPKVLMKEVEELKKMNSRLSAAVEEVTLEHCKKNEIVKHHSREVELQRRVFVDFFCNPDRLRNQVRELAARVRALQAQ